MSKKLLFTLLTTIILLAGLNSHVLAASGSVVASPSSATRYVNEEFNITVRVSGTAEFNTFSASVSTTNLTVISISKNSGINFVTNPSTGSLSFSGALLGSATTSINVYTITVKAPSEGTARLNISGGRIVMLDDQFSVSNISGAYTVNVRPTNTPRPTSKSVSATDAPLAASISPSISMILVTPTIDLASHGTDNALSSSLTDNTLRTYSFECDLKIIIIVQSVVLLASLSVNFIMYRRWKHK